VEAGSTASATDVGKVRVAMLAVEKKAVAIALETGTRFATAGLETIIDVQQDRMWFALPVPTGTYREALDFLATCRGGGYCDWRLPRPDEVQALLDAGGKEWVIARELFSFGADRTTEVSIWTNQTRWRWSRFRKEVTVIELHTGHMRAVPASAGAVQTLAVR
jgi:hypothetical protein